MYAIYSREPLPAFVDARAEVAAVLALGCDVLVALEKGGEVCDTMLVLRCVGVVRRRNVLCVPQVKKKAMLVAVLSWGMGALFRGDSLS